jgi:hypothetical protein
LRLTPAETAINLERMVFKWTALIFGCIGVLLETSIHASVSRSIPPRPDYYVLDEARVLDGRSTHAIESLLTEHDRLTNQQFMVAIFKNAANIAPKTQNAEKEWTHRLFVEWKIGKRHHNEGLLLTLFLESGHAFLEVGYGLEPKLSETNEILNQVVLPQLRHKDPKAAAIWGAYRILELWVSPLTQNGKAIEILKQDGISPSFAFTNDSYNDYYDHPAGSSGVWLALLCLGLSLLTVVFYQILSREAQFNSEGWYLDYPWSRRTSKLAKRGATESRAQLSTPGQIHSPIVEAIRLAEESTSGQIRVHISKKWLEKDPYRKARHIFQHHKMSDNPFRNSVLIYVNLRKMQFAILGDSGIDQVVGSQYWQDMNLELAQNLRSTQSERAIAFTVALVGLALKKYFPSKLT